MTSNTPLDSDLTAAWTAIADAMEANNADDLGAVLADEFTLGHMTGHRQARADWLADISAGQAVYHSVVTEGVDIDSTDPVSPVVTARTHTDVTIGGERGTWPTAFRVTLTHRDGRWIAASADGSAW